MVVAWEGMTSSAEKSEPPDGLSPSRRRVVVSVLVLALLMSCLAVVVIVKSVRRQSLKMDMNEAAVNLLEVGKALSRFERKYGGFPGPDTIAKVRQEAGAEWNLEGKASNALFRQLFATGAADNEVMFYNKTCTVPKVDNVHTPALALERGECGIAYLQGARKGDNPMRPLAVAPLVGGTDSFDRKALHGQAVVLLLEGGVRSLPIDRRGRVMMHGRDLMEPGNPVWEGRPPVIAWPDL